MALASCEGKALTPWLKRGACAPHLVMFERDDLDPRWAAGLKESLNRGTQLHVMRERSFDSSTQTHPDSPGDEPVCIDLEAGDGVCERDRRGQRGG